MGGKLGARAGVVVLALPALAWLGGTAWQLQQALLWPESAALGVAAAAALAGLLTLVGPGRLRGSWAGTTLLAAAAAVGSYACTDWRASQRLSDSLPAALEGQDLLVTGVIAELPRLSPRGPRFVFEAEHAARLHDPAAAPLHVPRRLALAWTTGYDGESLMPAPPQALRAGDRWQLPLRLKRPHGPSNPHGFDLELWLFEQGIGATGYVRPGARPLGPAGGAWFIERTRQSIRDAILVRVGDGSAAGVIAALVVGDQAAIERDEWELFRTTGVAHLMSISGLHVTMFAWLAGLAAGWAWRRSTRLMLWWPAPDAARWAGLVCAFGYALLAGFSVPAQRTVLMIAAVVLLRSLGWRWPALLQLLWVAVIVTLLDPWALMQPGFWLSFVAVAMLMVAGPQSTKRAHDGDAAQAIGPGAGSPPHARWRAPLLAALRTQAVASLALAPLTLVFFQQLSLVGFVANLFAIPLVTLLITPLSLAGVLLPPLWAVAAWLVHGLHAVLAAAAAVPWAVWAQRQRRHGASRAACWAACCCWRRCRGASRHSASRCCCRCWRHRSRGRPKVPSRRWWPISAKAPRCSCARKRTCCCTTPVRSTRPRPMPASVCCCRSLRARGEHHIDLLMLSHRDTDHVGGAASLLAALTVKASSSSLTPEHPLHSKLPSHRRCEAGQAWSWDGVQFELLHPWAGDHERQPPPKPNALSCVLSITAATGERLLLTGDVEALQEAALLERTPPEKLRSTWLLVPHHGSKTSSTAAFLATVQPRWALVQAAYRSRFGHPAPEVMARYGQQGVAVIRSDSRGAATLGPGFGPICRREGARRYWHHPSGPATPAR